MKVGALTQLADDEVLAFWKAQVLIILVTSTFYHANTSTSFLKFQQRQLPILAKAISAYQNSDTCV